LRRGIALGTLGSIFAFSVLINLLKVRIFRHIKVRRDIAGDILDGKENVRCWALGDGRGEGSRVR
jgi:hypothetical protein